MFKSDSSSSLSDLSFDIPPCKSPQIICSSSSSESSENEFDNISLEDLDSYIFENYNIDTKSLCIKYEFSSLHIIERCNELNYKINKVKFYYVGREMEYFSNSNNYILSKLPNLKKISINFYGYPHQRDIIYNCKLLEEIKINTIWNDIILDFSKFPNLKYLKIESLYDDSASLPCFKQLPDFSKNEKEIEFHFPDLALSAENIEEYKKQNVKCFGFTFDDYEQYYNSGKTNLELLLINF
uniref:Uncharacterized protein n=1 Tax=Pithovirus LCDPAC02 TaxID=2506601 RepID=A0A481YP92_9VIRU|nr:MAG: hypothetical protein LCDPAC02_02710 [Pithovirus LCDPAC02]